MPKRLTDIPNWPTLRCALLSACVFSLGVNLLMLAGPLYMLSVYDRVLGSRSEETLVSLTLLLAFVFLVMGILDYVRGRIMARIGRVLQKSWKTPFFLSQLQRASLAKHTPGDPGPLRDLDVLQKVTGQPVVLCLFDLPWAPLFFVMIFILHPWLGWLAVAGACVLLLIMVLNRLASLGPSRRALGLGTRADRTFEQVLAEAELISGQGMREAVFQRWNVHKNQADDAGLVASNRTGFFGVTTKTLRLFLQSAMLGLGALLVLRGEMTAGAMIASSILLGRGLAPIEQVIGQWQPLLEARDSWRRLRDFIAHMPETETPTRLPRPRAAISFDRVVAVPPGGREASLRLVSFGVAPGEALGIIGPSGAGKSTIARLITGTWPVMSGQIRLDGAMLDRFEPDTLGRYIGYLPQSVRVIDGTIAENIARFTLGADPDHIVEAARRADAHNMILRQPKGYDTELRASDTGLSGGQLQRIGLARALFGDPLLLVLDEPNAHLDNEGSRALNVVIEQMKAQGKAVIVIAHRPAAIEMCDRLLMLDRGARVDFGPRDEVLARRVQNASAIEQGRGAGGGIT